VNVASRLEGAAQPGEILLGPITYRLVREAVRVEALEPLELRGKRESVEAWRLVEVLPDVPAFTRRLDAPFVGRRTQLADLRGAFERSRDEGACELVTVVGAPGIGKSRLAREFLASLGRVARRCCLQGRRLHSPLHDSIPPGDA
jgi:AAA ATPase domain